MHLDGRDGCLRRLVLLKQPISNCLTLSRLSRDIESTCAEPPVSCVRKLIFTMAEQSISVVWIYSLLFCATLLVFQDPDMDNFCDPEKEDTQSYVDLSLEMSVKSTSYTAIAK